MILGYSEFIWILGHCCLIIGLSGIYFSKTKNFGSVRKSEEKEGIEQKRSYGIYVFYVITIVGIIWILILQMGKYIIYWFPLELIGYLLLISGLLILYFKKKKANWYRLENLPISYRFARRWKCKDCGNKFRSNIMQCPKCNGVDLKQRG